MQAYTRGVRYQGLVLKKSIRSIQPTNRNMTLALVAQVDSLSFSTPGDDDTLGLPWLRLHSYHKQELSPITQLIKPWDQIYTVLDLCHCPGQLYQRVTEQATEQASVVAVTLCHIEAPQELWHLRLLHRPHGTPNHKLTQDNGRLLPTHYTAATITFTLCPFTNQSLEHGTVCCQGERHKINRQTATAWEYQRHGHAGIAAAIIRSSRRPVTRKASTENQPLFLGFNWQFAASSVSHDVWGRSGHGKQRSVSELLYYPNWEPYRSVKGLSVVSSLLRASRSPSLPHPFSLHLIIQTLQIKCPNRFPCVLVLTKPPCYIVPQHAHFITNSNGQYLFREFSLLINWYYFIQYFDPNTFSFFQCQYWPPSYLNAIFFSTA